MNAFNILFIFLVLNTCGEKPTANHDAVHIGKWSGMDGWKNKGDVVLDNAGFAYLTIKGETLGGANYVVNGEPVELKYVINNSKKPNWIDFILYRKKDQRELGRLKGIIEFSDTKNARMLLNFNEDRFNNFENTDSNYIITLTKK